MTDLDAKIEALRAAVAQDDREGVDRHLAAIEPELQRLDPLVRGLSFAQVQSVLGNAAKAVEVLEDLAEVAPEVGVVQHQLGCHRRARGDADGALVAFTRATELDPELVAAWIERGVLLDAVGKPEEAVASYREAVLRAPQHPDAWRNMGNSLAALTRFEEAGEAYRTAAGLLPSDATVAVLLASTHLARGELEQANAALGEPLRAEMGEVVQVSTGPVGGRMLCCRFFVEGSRRASWEQAAERLLQQLAPVVQSVPGFPMRHQGAFVVLRDEQLLVCDQDAVRPGRPHRFFDATRLVEREAGRAPGEPRG